MDGQRKKRMQYEFSSTDKEKFSLHDCMSTAVELINDRLIFKIPDGIFCVDYSKDWPNTGNAEVEFVIDPMRGVYLNLFVDSDGQTIRKDITLDRLVEKINNSEWKLEFAYRYDGYESVLYRCWIWTDEEPWSYEAELWIGTKEDTVFRWNSPEEVKADDNADS
ncbi:MAG: hypothetical protein IKO30_06280 [Lachnospiraceae bacterium]|nr:hypothetical protein [Lachnospiraceae bacterium]